MEDPTISHAELDDRLSHYSSVPIYDRFAPCCWRSTMFFCEWIGLFCLGWKLQSLSDCSLFAFGFAFRRPMSGILTCFLSSSFFFFDRKTSIWSYHPVHMHLFVFHLPWRLALMLASQEGKVIDSINSFFRSLIGSSLWESSGFSLCSFWLDAFRSGYLFVPHCLDLL